MFASKQTGNYWIIKIYFKDNIVATECSKQLPKLPFAKNQHQIFKKTTISWMRALQFLIGDIQQLKMEIKLWISVLLLIGVFGQDDFQRRAIYYSQADNVCRFGWRSDAIRITVLIDGLETKNIVGNGGTSCSQWYAEDWARISPSSYWLAASEDYKQYYLKFDDETQSVYAGGVLLAIIQKSRVRNPAIINNAPHDCRIYGDKQIKHFGIDFEGQKPAEIYMKCNRITSDTKPLQRE